MRRPGFGWFPWICIETLTWKPCERMSSLVASSRSNSMSGPLEWRSDRGQTNHLVNFEATNGNKNAPQANSFFLSRVLHSSMPKSMLKLTDENHSIPNLILHSSNRTSTTPASVAVVSENASIHSQSGWSALIWSLTPSPSSSGFALTQISSSIRRVFVWRFPYCSSFPFLIWSRSVRDRNGIISVHILSSHLYDTAFESFILKKFKRKIK